MEKIKLKFKELLLSIRIKIHKKSNNNKCYTEVKSYRFEEILPYLREGKKATIASQFIQGYKWYIKLHCPQRDIRRKQQVENYIKSLKENNITTSYKLEDHWLKDIIILDNGEIINYCNNCKFFKYSLNPNDKIVCEYNITSSDIFEKWILID